MHHIRYEGLKNYLADRRASMQAGDVLRVRDDAEPTSRDAFDGQGLRSGPLRGPFVRKLMVGLVGVDGAAHHKIRDRYFAFRPISQFLKRAVWNNCPIVLQMSGTEKRIEKKCNLDF